jgi:hypothetical protein
MLESNLLLPASGGLTRRWLSMDILSFTASIVSSLAWPLATLGALILLRRELSSLLPFLRRLKAGPVEAEFEREVEELRDETTVLQPAPEASLIEGRTAQLLRLAEISPRAAVSEAWRGVEAAARKLILKGADESKPLIIFPHQLVKRLEELNALVGGDRKLFQDLKALRNQAAHAPEFSPSYESVVGYLQLAGSLESRLQVLAIER